jgi:hypothetical protein
MTPEDATKYAAILFLLALGLSSLYIAVVDTIQNIELPSYIQLVIGSGVTYCLTALSINHGSNLTLKGVQNGNTQPIPTV